MSATELHELVQTKVADVVDSQRAACGARAFCKTDNGSSRK